MPVDDGVPVATTVAIEMGWHLQRRARTALIENVRSIAGSQ
jgi:hypothetical protein